MARGICKSIRKLPDATLAQAAAQEWSSGKDPKGEKRSTIGTGLQGLARPFLKEMNMDFSKRLLTVIFVITVILIVINMIFFFFTGSYMEELFHDWMAYIFSGECLIMGVIKVAKVGSDAITEKKKKDLEQLSKMTEWSDPNDKE